MSSGPSFAFLRALFSLILIVLVSADTSEPSSWYGSKHGGVRARVEMAPPRDGGEVAKFTEPPQSKHRYVYTWTMFTLDRDFQGGFPFGGGCRCQIKNFAMCLSPHLLARSMRLCAELEETRALSSDDPVLCRLHGSVRAVGHLRDHRRRPGERAPPGGHRGPRARRVVRRSPVVFLHPAAGPGAGRCGPHCPGGARPRAHAALRDEQGPLRRIQPHVLGRVQVALHRFARGGLGGQGGVLASRLPGDGQVDRAAQQPGAPGHPRGLAEGCDLDHRLREPDPGERGALAASAGVVPAERRQLPTCTPAADGSC